MNIHSPIIEAKIRAPNWSPDELALLRQCWAGKMPLKQIWRRLPGRTLCAVRTKSASLGLESRHGGDKRFFVGVPVTKELLDKIESGASQLGITKAEFIRRAVERCSIEAIAG